MKTHYLYWALFFYVFSLLLSFSFIHLDQVGYLGSSTDLYVYLSEQFTLSSYEAYDTQGNIYIQNPFYALVELLSLFIPLELIVLFLPSLLGLTAFLLLYLILQEFKLPEELKLSIMFLYAFSSVFLNTYFYFTPYSFLVPFVLLIIYLHMKQSYYSYVSTFLSLFLIFFGFKVALFLYVLYGVIAFFLRDKLYYVIGPAHLFLLTFSYFVLPSVPIVHGAISVTFLISTFFVELGSRFGFGFFVVVLVIAGIILGLKQKQKYLVAYLLLLICLLFYPVLGSIVFYFMQFPFSFFAGVALHNLFSRKWLNDEMKLLSFILVFSGIIFSVLLTFFSSLTPVVPTDVTRSLPVFESYEEGVVLTYYTYGYALERQGIIPFVTLKSSQLNTKLNLSNSVYHEKQLDVALNLLHANNISYILIDDVMRNGVVFTKENEGLLFLLTDTDSFTLLYNTNNVTIYKVN